MTFLYPAFFFLLLLCVPLVLWYVLSRKRDEASLRVASAAPFYRSSSLFSSMTIHLPFVLRMVAFVLFVIVLARPQTKTPLTEREVEGIDIMIAMDISQSMLTEDLRPNRIEAAKQVAYEFIQDRPTDNIGLTLFGGEAFTQCPMTTDHTALLSMFRSVSCDLQTNGTIAPGTAIGMGLANAVNRLTNSKAPSKVVILLTDGANNAGDISPLTAAEIAKQKGIRVYTIAVGRQGMVRQPVGVLPDGSYYYANVKSDMDPATLRSIAQTTGGIYYAASSKKELQNIYKDIDKLERRKLKQHHYNKYYEAFPPFAWTALMLLLIEVLLRLTWLRRIP